MNQTPCEYMVWNGLPVIRREIAECMINDFHLNQKQTAEKLGVTPAAISQYVSGKRGKIKFDDENLKAEIRKSAENIINNGSSRVHIETCRICKYMIKHDFFSVICDTCSNETE